MTSSLSCSVKHLSSCERRIVSHSFSLADVIRNIMRNELQLPSQKASFGYLASNQIPRNEPSRIKKTFTKITEPNSQTSNLQISKNLINRIDASSQNERHFLLWIILINAAAEPQIFQHYHSLRISYQTVGVVKMASRCFSLSKRSKMRQNIPFRTCFFFSPPFSFKCLFRWNGAVSVPWNTFAFMCVPLQCHLLFFIGTANLCQYFVNRIYASISKGTNSNDKSGSLFG